MRVCVCMWVARKTSLRQLFNFNLYWFLLKFVIILYNNFRGIIKNHMVTVVAVYVGEGVRACASAIHVSTVTDFIQPQFNCSIWSLLVSATIRYSPRFILLEL